MMKKHAIFFLLFLIPCLAANSQQNTVGVIFNEGSSFDGYTLFSPAGNNIAYLINNDGRIVNQWESDYPPGNAVYLQDDGTLYRAGRVENDRIHAGGAGGVIERFDWEGNVIWTYFNSSEFSRAHHDFQVLPNGNVLVLVWEEILMEEVLANGRNPELLPQEKLWPEMVLEIEPSGSEGGNVVWEWHAWDHLVQDFDDTKQNFGVVSENIGRIDLNFMKPGKEGADWHHANAISYNPDLDQIMISLLNFDEIWVIDHSTSLEESSGPKGDLIFRWGNPQAYQVGNEGDKMLFGQHNTHWIPSGLPDAGKILVFNNGRDRPEGKYTSVVKINPVIENDISYKLDENGMYLPAEFDYEYTADVPTDFYAWYISGAQQLPNGHLLINDGAHGTFFEIDQNEEFVWKYINPVAGDGPLDQGQLAESPSGDPINGVFRALKYDKDYGAFEGKSLVPGAFVELQPITSAFSSIQATQLYPNPTRGRVTINTPTTQNSIELISLSGRIVYSQKFNTNNIELDLEHLDTGIYQVLLNQKPFRRLILTQ